MYWIWHPFRQNCTQVVITCSFFYIICGLSFSLSGETSVVVLPPFDSNFILAIVKDTSRHTEVFEPNVIVYFRISLCLLDASYLK